jgi:predicted TIM-barrel fold metal-dependent hydrolase
MQRAAALVAGVLFAASLLAQEEKPQAGATLTFEEYEPKSTLVVPAHPRTKAKFPFIDIHNHQRRDMTAADVEKLIADMDRIGLSVMVNLSGGSGSNLQQGLQTLRAAHPKRFVVFANVDFSKIDEPDFATKAAQQLETDVRNGAVGLKVYKNVGMFLVDKSGKRVPTDDARLDPIWRKAGELGIPVLIHTGEPIAFWQPVDKYNERWLELTQFPERRRTDPKFASFEQTMAEQRNLFRKHPKTKFIAAHLAWLGHDLTALGKMLDELPNVYTEIGAVLHELGRQPRAARAFMIQYQDRVLMGKDIWNADEYATYFRVLETDDEYFDYYRKRHAFWKMYGLNLPDDVLKKIYYKNALTLMPSIDASAFPK